MAEIRRKFGPDLACRLVGVTATFDPMVRSLSSALDTTTARQGYSAQSSGASAARARN